MTSATRHGQSASRLNRSSERAILPLMATSNSDRPFGALLAYSLGTVALVLWALLPSEVETSYTWEGVLLELVLIAGLFAGLNLCRWALIIIGGAAAFGTVALQSAPLEFVATGWSVLALLVTAILLTPPIRRYTARSGILGRAGNPAAGNTPHS